MRTLKSFMGAMVMLVLMFTLTSLAFAADPAVITPVVSVSAGATPAVVTPPVALSGTPVLGFGPSVMASAGAFYFNGNYTLLSGGVNIGAAYTFADKTMNNVNTIGLYVGPQSGLVNGVTSTTMNLSLYCNLYQTATAGAFGAGIGTQLWKSGVGLQVPTSSTAYFLVGYNF